MLRTLLLLLVAVGGPVGLVTYIMLHGRIQKAKLALSSEDHYSRLKTPASSTLSYQSQSTSRTLQPVPSSDHKQQDTRSIEWACQVLGLTMEGLTPETIEKAYNRKMEAYQASDQQNLPESIQQLLHEKIQEVKEAKKVLSEGNKI